MSQMVELTVDECLALLARGTVGRIALRTERGLRIFPVNYALDGDDVVFRTAPYGVIANNAHGAEVAFEVDHLEEGLRAGWSVVAAGRCQRIEDPGEVRVVRTQDDPEPWAEGLRNLYFRLRWVDLTGRQIGMAERPSLIPSRSLDPLEPPQRLRALLGVVHDRSRVALDSLRLVDLLGRHVRQLRHPARDVGPVRVELLALRGRVEDPEVRRRVGAGARDPLPVVLVGGQVAVGQPLHEVPGAVPPPHVQVLDEERRRRSSAPGCA